jgi:hypothetical protein
MFVLKKIIKKRMILTGILILFLFITNGVVYSRKYKPNKYIDNPEVMHAVNVYCIDKPRKNFCSDVHLQMVNSILIEKKRQLKQMKNEIIKDIFKIILSS